MLLRSLPALAVSLGWLLAGFLLGAMWQATKEQAARDAAPVCKLTIPDASFLPENFYWQSTTLLPDGNICVN